MGRQWLSPCKVNLLLNILGRRADGFHELETVMQPIPVHDVLEVELRPEGIALECGVPELPVDRRNLVYRAAEAFFAASKVTGGVAIRLDKRLPLAAGLGGGSGNAATTLLALNELHGAPLDLRQLSELAAALGSDVPFFLHGKPGLAEGRGEKVTPLDSFAALAGLHIVLVHPGFGISTPWAYRELARFPAALNGAPGRARRLIDSLQRGSLSAGLAECYNSLEAPAFEKYPVLGLFQGYFRKKGALATLMSGSGSATFALFGERTEAEQALADFPAEFGTPGWQAIATL